MRARRQVDAITMTLMMTMMTMMIIAQNGYVYSANSIASRSNMYSYKYREYSIADRNRMLHAWNLPFTIELSILTGISSISEVVNGAVVSGRHRIPDEIRSADPLYRIRRKFWTRAKLIINWCRNWIADRDKINANANVIRSRALWHE